MQFELQGRSRFSAKPQANPLPLLRRAVFAAVIWLAAFPAYGSQSPPPGIPVSQVASSNVVFYLGGIKAPDQPDLRNPKISTAIAGLVETNGRYRIDIEMEGMEETLPVGTHPMPLAGLVETNGLFGIEIEMSAEDEVIPAGTNPMPLDMREALLIYSKLTGAELQVENDVRQFQGFIQLPASYPPTTRAQAAELVETALRDQAGVEVIRSDNTHAVLRFQIGPANGATQAPRN